MPIMFQETPHFGTKRTLEISFLHSEKLQKNPVLELCYKGLYGGHTYLSSCNELTLVSYEYDPCYAGTFRFAVINPLSKQRHDLPPISIKIKPDRTYEFDPWDASGIGFDDSTNTFKTVFVILSKPDLDVVCTMVHTSGMNSWRKIAQTPPYVIYGEGVFGHGRFHWFGEELHGDYVSPPKDGRKIVWFDVKMEEFGLMDAPDPIKELGLMDPLEINAKLVNFNGEVGLAYVGPIYITLLILKQKEWVLHCSFDFTLHVPKYMIGCCDVKVLGCWNKDGDILLTYDKWKINLFVYTLKTSDWRQVFELPDICVENTRMCKMYQSSLLSVLKSSYSVKNCKEGKKKKSRHSRSGMK